MRDFPPFPAPRDLDQVMFRIVGKAILALSVLAGPRLCCCEFAPLAAACVSHDDAVHPSHADHHDCCHAAPRQEVVDDAQPCSHEKHSSCPCGKDPIGLDKIVKHVGNAADILFFHFKPALNPIAVIEVPSLTDSCSPTKFSSESTAFPYLGCRDILRALSTLLC